ncbi:MAG: DUF1697 domain-containing protein [Eudoraea sp.]|nr:DUF1697 domain-containing protein [Eudoraea sp.]MBT8223642.1 DUF1697 domain-containing protein [Eudoraea sp.]NNJ41327.1 DUF1697 domain-containing protein [Eudoraea sp.]
MKQKYVAFLRGINVGGHHKVPMSLLREEMEKLDFKSVVTLLNSGNILFDAVSDDLENLEKRVSEHLETVFGFPIPTIICRSETIYSLLEKNPFKDIAVTKNIRLYISFLKKKNEMDLKLPWTSDDGSYKIIAKTDNTILSVLDLSVTNTPQAMDILRRRYGSDITTRNWNTIKRLEKKLGSGP